jgi:predicted DNA-binding protein (MmcQ/YjbR family)
MNIDWVREWCLSLPHTTEKVQWGDNLVFKVGGKIYAIVALEPGSHWLAFKCTAEEFAELVERPGIVPAPYLARAHWVSLQTAGALPPAEIKRLLRQAYDLIFAKLPKKTQAELQKTVVRRQKAEGRKQRAGSR